ncbi:MAG: hypothetical protein FJX78_06865 [Armatimonadetes bacterium]|nr:hypothetical protein [Armatimonadota bacterium]
MPDSKFANDSETEFARILDFYRVRWEYEPRSFVLARDAAGRPTSMFMSDFYLPDFALYIELTTLKQSLIRHKNQKIRRLRELYPDVQIKIFYGRDFRGLLARFGLRPPAQNAP